MTHPEPAAGGPPIAIVVGIGLRRNANADDIHAALRAAFAGYVIRGLATVETRATHPALAAVAAGLGVPVSAFTAAQLSAVEVPNSSAHALRTLGTASVAEAAAILAGSRLIVARRVLGGVVVAAAVAGP